MWLDVSFSILPGHQYTYLLKKKTSYIQISSFSIKYLLNVFLLPTSFSSSTSELFTFLPLFPFSGYYLSLKKNYLTASNKQGRETKSHLTLNMISHLWETLICVPLPSWPGWKCSKPTPFMRKKNWKKSCYYLQWCGPTLQFVSGTVKCLSGYLQAKS